jgi:hypothetical protein
MPPYCLERYGSLAGGIFWKKQLLIHQHTPETAQKIFFSPGSQRLLFPKEPALLVTRIAFASDRRLSI